MRKLALQYTPFLPWSINALSFLGKVLPIDHPVLTAAIAAADSALTDYRKQHGLEEGQKGAVPGFLMGTLPTSHGGHLNVTRYTPAGFFADPLNTIAGNVLPQFGGVLDAFKGSDWKGKELKNNDGTPYTTYQKLGYAAAQGGTSLVPGLNILANAVGGLPDIPASPGKSPLSRIWYAQNPVRITKAPKKKTGGSGWGSSSTSSKSGWGSSSTSGAQKTGWGG
jgi:hypothetical protein